MQLFNRSEVNNPKFPEFTRRMHYIKRTEGGRRKMCAIMEEYAKECIDEAIRGKIDNALKNDEEPQAIARILDVPLETVLEIKEQMLHN